MTEKVVRKKVTKKTTQKTATRKAAAKKTARKTAAKKTTRKKTVKTVASETTIDIDTLPTNSVARKAPTPIAQDKEDMAYTRNLLIGSFITLLVFLGVSAFIGFSDGGEIVVSNEVQKRLETATPEERTAIENAGKPTIKSTKPMGGLVGTGDSGTPKKPTPEPETTNASSSDEVATSTEAVSYEEESVENVEDDSTSEEITEEVDGTASSSESGV